MQDDLAAFGLPPDAFEEATADAENHCEVWPENWDTVMVFIGLQTQWRKEIVPMAGNLIWHGLNYPAVESVIRLRGYTGKKAQDIFDGLQVMESAALPLLNKSSK